MAAAAATRDNVRLLSRSGNVRMVCLAGDRDHVSEKLLNSTSVLSDQSGFDQNRLK